MFTGRAGWQYAMVYEWTGSAWRQLPRPDNAFKYLDGVSDLTEGVPDGVFADVFCRALWAQQAFIDQLRTRLITLESPGAIESKGFDSGISGFRIRHDGDAEFNNARFNGGYFDGKLVAGPIWDKNGNVVATGVRLRSGGLFVNHRTLNDPRMHIANPMLFGDIALGEKLPGNPDDPEIFINAPVTVSRGCNSRTDMQVHETLTLDQLKDKIINLYKMTVVGTYIRIPVTGCISGHVTSSMDSQQPYDIIVSGMGYLNGNYTIYGNNITAVTGMPRGNVAKIISGTERVMASLVFI
jgi:hypothetical protein